MPLNTAREHGSCEQAVTAELLWWLNRGGTALVFCYFCAKQKNKHHDI